MSTSTMKSKLRDFSIHITFSRTRSTRNTTSIWSIFRSSEIWLWINTDLYIPFLGEWTSIYQLFWCSPGVQGFDTLPFLHLKRPISCHRHRSPSCSREQILKGDLVAIRQTDRHIWEIQRHIVLEGCRAGRADPQEPGNVATSRPKIWSFLMVLMKKWDIRWHLIL